MEDSQYLRGKLTKKLCDEIKDMIMENDVCCLKAPPGIGKSTTIPMHLYYTMPQGTKIFIVFPTVVAVRSTVKSILDRKPELAEFIGMGAEGEINYTDTTPIVVVTAGHFHKKLLKYIKNGILTGDMNFCDVIFLDEAHEGTMHYEVIMGAWALAYKQTEATGFKVPNLVLSSATLDLKITPFSDNIVNITVPDEERHYKIDYEYYGKDFKLGDAAIFPETGKAVKQRHYELGMEPTEISKWIVFIPGEGDARKVEAELLGVENMKTVILMGSTQRDVTPIINAPSTPGERLVIIASKVAESSVTFSMVDGVFDTLIEKVMIAKDGGVSVLTAVPIGQSNTKQRCGRTGRDRDGFCLRMCTKEFYENMKKTKPTELLIANLSPTFLDLARYGIYPGLIFGRRLSKERLDLFYEILVKLGMVEMNEEGVYKTTNKGVFASSIPVSVRSAAFLWEWLFLAKTKDYHFFPAIVFAAIIENSKDELIFYRRKETGEEFSMYSKYKTKTFNKTVDDLGLDKLSSPISIYLEIYDKIVVNFGGNIKPPERQLNAYCSKYNLNSKSVGNVFKTVRDVYQRMIDQDFYKRHGIVIEPSLVGDDTDNFFKLIKKKIVRRVYFDKVFEKVGKKYINIDGDAYTIGRNSHYCPGLKESDKIVALGENTRSNVKGPDIKEITLFLNMD